MPSEIRIHFRRLFFMIRNSSIFSTGIEICFCSVCSRSRFSLIDFLVPTFTQ